MPYYRRVGEVPAKRHTLSPRADGGWYAEELMGHRGLLVELGPAVPPPLAVGPRGASSAVDDLARRR